MQLRKLIGAVLALVMALSLVAAPAFAASSSTETTAQAATSTSVPKQLAPASTSGATSPISIKLGQWNGNATGNLTYGNFSMKVGEQITMRCSTSTLPSGVHLKNGILSSSDTSIVSVAGSDWIITALKPGVVALTATVTFSDGSIETDTVTVTVTGATKPAALWSNSLSSFTLGNKSTLIFIVKKNFSLFSGVVKVDGKTIKQSKDYTAKSGSTEITLLNSYLNSLSAGKHTLTVSFTDGTKIDTTFKVKATPLSTLPPTGDSSSLAAVSLGVLLLAVGGTILLTTRRRDLLDQ